MSTPLEFQYRYERIYDYYIIEAWRRLKRPLPAYTPEMVERHTALIMDLPWAAPTPSGDDRGIIGMTVGWLKDTGGKADYFWDIHGPQETGNWRTPSNEARTNRYAEALMRRESEVVRCGPESGFKPQVAEVPPGKLMLYAMSGQGLRVRYPYVYEPGGWTMERLLDTGRNLALALYDVIAEG